MPDQARPGRRGLDGLVGTTTTSGARVLDESDLGLLCTLTWAISELHTNKELMRSSQFGERLFAGPVLVSVVIGLHRSSPTARELFGRYGLQPGTLTTLNARYVGAVLPDDAVSVATTVTGVQADDGPPTHGTITLEDTATNQKGDVVLAMTRVHRVTLGASGTMSFQRC